MQKNTSLVYNKCYFEDGIANGVSLYENYRWIPELTIPMAHDLIKNLGIRDLDHVLDFGCAKGYLVKALRLLGINSFGVDISEYALKSAPSDVKDFLWLKDEFTEDRYFDLVIAKDVLEHVPYEELDDTVHWIMERTGNLFVAVPLGDGEEYVIPQMELDSTHIVREPLNWWVNRFRSLGYASSGDYSLGSLKNKWVEQYPQGNGFIGVFK